MPFKSLNAAALLLAASATHATAQDAPDYYVTGAIDVSIADGWEGNFDPATSTPRTGGFESSPMFRLGVGYDYDGPLRAEVELAHRALDVSDFYINPIAPATQINLDVTSDVEVTTLMINGLYDFDLPTSDYVIYLGAGLGMAHVDIDLQRGPSATGFPSWQGITPPLRVNCAWAWNTPWSMA